MASQSILLFPPPSLASCMSLAIVRDTRRADLADADRLNYFPASPLVALSVVAHGELRYSDALCDLSDIRRTGVLASITATPPQTQPSLSWSDGPINAITVGFFPDAWASLGGDVASGDIPKRVSAAAAIFLQSDDIAADWPKFCTTLESIWTPTRKTQGPAQWAGSHKVADWTRHLLTHAALSGVGQSARSFERRMKRWTGQSKQSLRAFAQLEDLHGLRIKDPHAALASIAADAQFSDQSHMGRAVKKATGFPPAQLNQLIDTNEAFWCYRLLGERL